MLETNVRAWRAIAFIASSGAAALHLAATKPHLEEYLPAGVFMLVAGIAQLTTAIAIAHRPTLRTCDVGMIGNGLIVALWFVSRTAGLPFGPEPGMPEHIHLTDALATALEILVIIGCFALTREDVPRADPALLRLALFGALTATAVAAHDPGAEQLTAAATLALAIVLRASIPYLPRLTWRSDVDVTSLRIDHAAGDALVGHPALGAR